MGVDTKIDIARVDGGGVTWCESDCKWFESYCPGCDWIIVWPRDAKPENKCWTCSGTLQPTTEEQRERCSLFIYKGAEYAALEIILRRLQDGRS